MQIASVDFEQGRSALYSVSPLHIDGRHDAGDWRADRNVFGAGFDNAWTEDVGGEWRAGGLHDRLGGRRSSDCPE